MQVITMAAHHSKRMINNNNTISDHVHGLWATFLETGQRDFQGSIPTHTSHCLVEKTDAYMKNSKCAYGHGKKELETIDPTLWGRYREAAAFEFRFK